MRSRPSGMRWSSATRARSSRSRFHSRTPPRWTRSRKRRVSRSIRCSAMPRTSKRRAAGSPRAMAAARLAGTRLLASDAALGAAEEVADPGHGLDHVARLAVRPEFSPKAAHVQLHQVSAYIRVVTPHALEYFLLREYAAGVRHEMPEQLELGRR